MQNNDNTEKLNDFTSNDVDEVHISLEKVDSDTEMEEMDNQND